MTQVAIGSAQENYAYVILISVLVKTNNAINSKSLKVGKLHNAEKQEEDKAFLAWWRQRRIDVVWMVLWLAESICFATKA